MNRKSSNPTLVHKYIGQSWRDPALEAIATGQLVYSRDVSLPDMLYGEIMHQPTFDAQIKSLDVLDVSSMSGVVTTVVDLENNFVGVVADNPFILPKALEAINIKWKTAPPLNHEAIMSQLDVERHREDNAFEHELLSSGDMSSAKESSKYHVAARYDTSFAAHGAIEPRSAVAWVREEKIEIYCGSQDPFFVQKLVAKAIGRNDDEVVVHSHRLGGGFGGRVRCQAAEEAAILSAAVSRPVRVQWDRETEFQNNYFQPPFSHYIDAGVTGEGDISHWEHDFVSSPIITGAVPKNIAWMVDMVVADEGTARGSLSPYEIENKKVRYSDIRTPVPIGAWRGLGAAPNTFAIESMIDELSVVASIDPLSFRLNNLPTANNKLVTVLQTVAEMASWGRSTAVNVGRGIACAVYKGETAVAIVAEIQIDHEEKGIRVNHVWCAHDSGLVINPDQVKNQIMGNIIWGCSMALKEQLNINEGAVDARNFDGYEILRHIEAPDISITLISSENTLPTGVGESAFGPVAPAIANAVFAATNRRMRRLPMDYALVFESPKD